MKHHPVDLNLCHLPEQPIKHVLYTMACVKPPNQDPSIILNPPHSKHCTDPKSGPSTKLAREAHEGGTQWRHINVACRGGHMNMEGHDTAAPPREQVMGAVKLRCLILPVFIERHGSFYEGAGFFSRMRLCDKKKGPSQAKQDVFQAVLVSFYYPHSFKWHKGSLFLPRSQNSFIIISTCCGCGYQSCRNRV